MAKKIIPVIVVVAVLAAFFYFKFAKTNNFMYAGTVESTEVDLSSRLNGVISDVNVHEGDDVSKGQVLVTLSIEDIKVAAEAAQSDYKRAAELLEAGALNQEAFDRIKFKRDDTAVRLSWGTIRSPIDGVVITMYHEPGEMVNPGSKLLTIDDLRHVWAYIYVSQETLSTISIGMQVEGFVPEANMRKIPGKIININKEAEFTPKNVQTRKERTRLVFGVKIGFENEDGFLKPGMTVEVKLQ